MDISVEISKILSEYGDEVIREMRPVIDEVVKEGVKTLKDTSPRTKRAGGRHYANGWRSKTEWTRFGASSVVYNATKPGLTHLLENGHAKMGGGRTRAIPHIRPVEEWVNKEVVTKLKRRLSQ